MALDAFESRKAELKGDGKAGRWFSPLQLHVLPKLGKVPVSDIDQRDIRDTLAPIWHTKADTAKKAMDRLGICLRHAAALGLDVDMQATDKAKALLGKQRHTVKHIPSLHWRDVPTFYQSLSEGTVTELALRLLTAKSTRQRCKCPSKRGWNVCRLHGAEGGAPFGTAHPNYRHGMRTKEMENVRRLTSLLGRKVRDTIEVVT
ncbi:phage integrase central domain-containing protein [Litoreibacter janthinus]|uniref:phage integrase central domain-containing protein n=1 Tax=Litoreibacter janthinus TaxID=670154 RepID=UPI003CCBFEF2